MTTTIWVFPDDLVTAILYEINKNGHGKRFVADREQLHSTFYQLKLQFPDLFASLHFRDKGFFPESEDLDQALSNLEASNLLQRHNKTPKYYLIQDRLDDSFTRFVQPRLNNSGIDEAILSSAAEKFIACIKV